MAQFYKDLFVRYQPGAEQAAIEHLKQVFDKVNPGYPFAYNFPARTESSRRLFFVAVVISFGIAVSVVSFHTLRVARKNPIASLKYE